MRLHPRTVTLLCFLLLSSLVISKIYAGQQNPSPASDTESLYRKQCAICHDAGVPRAPNRAALSAMSVENIRFALTKGAMKSQASKLSPAQIDSLSSFLSKIASVTELPNRCSDAASAWTDLSGLPQWNGWGVSPLQHRFQPADMAQLSAQQVPNLKVKWAFGFPGVSRAAGQPTVFGGRVFVGSLGRRVYSLNAATGCTYWEFDTEGPVRTAISIGALGSGWAAYFGDGRANAYAVDALTGKLLWKTQLEDYPGAVITGAPTLAAGRLYVPVSSFEEVLGADPRYECCKFRGSVSSLDAASGVIIWKQYTISEAPKPVRKNPQGVQLWGPSGAAVWSSPTVDVAGHRVYVTTGDSYSNPAATTSDSFLALDMDTGAIVWSKQMTAGDAFIVSCFRPDRVERNCPEKYGEDFDFGSSPILVDLPGEHRALIAGQKSGVVHALDPDRQGAILWQTRVAAGGNLGGVQWGSAVDGVNVYAAVSDQRVQGVAPGTPGSQPSYAPGQAFLLDSKTGGGVFALDLATGKVAWSAPPRSCGDQLGCSPAQSAAVTAIPGVVFSGGVNGHLRAYSTQDGKLLWDVDTNQSYKAVNGVPANGGAMDGPGPVIVGGMLFVNSGYGLWGGGPGNVLLAFSVDGK